MAVMKKAVDKEDFDRMDKGLKPRPKPKKVMPEPEAPEVGNHIKLEQIPLDEVSGFTEERRILTNKEGVRFVGVDVSIVIKGKKPISGWMSERDFIKLCQATGRLGGR